MATKFSRQNAAQLSGLLTQIHMQGIQQQAWNKQFAHKVRQDTFNNRLNAAGNARADRAQSAQEQRDIDTNAYNLYRKTSRTRWRYSRNNVSKPSKGHLHTRQRQPAIVL
jgi:hypothetical protein